jgi:hypothetical protein
MNLREQFCETILFGKPDRIPLFPGGGRESTLARWHQEGLPKEVCKSEAVTEYAYRLAGGKLELPRFGPGFWVQDRMIPQFEEKVIERKERSQIVQDWKGNICEISNEFELRHLRDAIDFVTRRWIKCPVESRADWENMKLRYNPEDPARLPDHPEELGRRLLHRDYPIRLHVSGPFWQLREWLGFESLCMMLHDDPEFIREMIEFWQDFIVALLKRVLKYFQPDWFHISEDMAYKKFSMISPQMCREFLMPCWRKWGEIIRQAGVPIYAIDSDGYIGELIPLWIEVGICCCDPVEVAAGNDLNAFQSRFGKNMAYCGGVDKRCIAEGGKTLEEEIKRIEPVIAGGGYLPGCDHGVPSDVSWPNFVQYVGLLAKRTGWL